MNDEGETSKVDGVWRIVIGISLIPAFGTLYQRLTLPESTRFKKSQGEGNEEEGIEDLKEQKKTSEDGAEETKSASEIEGSIVKQLESAKTDRKAHFKGSFLLNSVVKLIRNFSLRIRRLF
jgi:PHS family inorganic phosphate transporter-like MFS transporter